MSEAETEVVRMPVSETIGEVLEHKLNFNREQYASLSPKLRAAIYEVFGLAPDRLKSSPHSA